MASWAELDEAFTLPGTIPEESPLRTLYYKLLIRTQEELGLLPLVTPEMLLVERYLTQYILMKHRESLAIGDSEGFMSADVAKAVSAHWLGIAKEVTALIDRARTRSDKDSVSKRAAVQVAYDVINQGVPDDDKRRELLRDLVGAYDRMGV
jgi:hypothetical protein